jgi:hypothetical protein
MARSELTRTNVTTGDIVTKLWNLSKALQGAGISYQGYITELRKLSTKIVFQQADAGLI